MSFFSSSIIYIKFFIRQGRKNQPVKQQEKSEQKVYAGVSKIGLFFCQRTNQPDHCTYFALKDLGMDKIPVYVNKQSYEAGRILGLFE